MDGTYHQFTPESMQIQHEAGADVIMAFDECPPYPSTWEYARDSMERTHRWAERCLAAHEPEAAGQALFGIVQGSTYADLRAASARAIGAMPFPGIAIGGVSVGEPPEEMRRVLDDTLPLLPADRPRYLMGVGTPEDILDAVAAGVDMFDCVLPTRLGRNGTLYTSRGRVNIANARWADDSGPVDPDCPCRVCRRHSAAYLRHLQDQRDFGQPPVSYHNLAFYARLMADPRRHRGGLARGVSRHVPGEQWRREGAPRTGPRSHGRRLFTTGKFLRGLFKSKKRLVYKGCQQANGADTRGRRSVMISEDKNHGICLVSGEPV